jgi:hypothetical protein
VTVPSSASVYDAEQATVHNGLSADLSVSKYPAFSIAARKCTLAAKFSPVWQPWVQTGRPAAEASAAIRSASVTPPQLDRAETSRDPPTRLLGGGGGRGAAEREAARICGHRPGRAAQEPVQRLAEPLAVQVPACQVDPGHDRGPLTADLA